MLAKEQNGTMLAVGPMLSHDVQIVDLVWIDPAAFGLATGAAANVKNLLADAKTNYVLVRAESAIAGILRDVAGTELRIIAVGRTMRRLKRELWVLWLAARAKLGGRRVFYTSWVPRLCLCALVLPIKSRVFVHDFNIFRKRIYDARFSQPSRLSRLHQYVSIKRATVVQCFARSVARQLGRVRREAIPVVAQTVHLVAPAAAVKPGNRAVIFLDDRNYKGVWALPRFFTSQPGFRLTVIGRIDAASEAMLRARGIDVAVLRPTDEEKFKLLAEADYVIFASKYEGYGLPPREAAALGTPSMIARRAALLDIPAQMSLSIDRLGQRIDLADTSRQAARIDRRVLRAWAGQLLGPVSSSWELDVPPP